MQKIKYTEMHKHTHTHTQRNMCVCISTQPMKIWKSKRSTRRQSSDELQACMWQKLRFKLE